MDWGSMLYTYWLLINLFLFNQSVTCPGYNINVGSGNCNFRGSCELINDKPTCVCNEGWFGTDCSFGNF